MWLKVHFSALLFLFGRHEGHLLCVKVIPQQFPNKVYFCRSIGLTCGKGKKVKPYSR